MAYVQIEKWNLQQKPLISMNEIWATVPNTNGYYKVSNLGRIVSYRFSVPKELKTHVVKGYEQCCIFYNKRKTYTKVHRVVALSFLPNPENKRTVNHKDGNKLNNRLNNLEWATYSENHLHAFRTKLRPKVTGFKHKASIMVLNYKTGVCYGSVTQAAIENGIKRPTLEAKLKGGLKNDTSFIMIR